MRSPDPSGRPGGVSTRIRVARSGPPREETRLRTPLQRLADHGQSPWIQHLARDWIHDREHGLPRLIRCGISGVVSDPVSLATALAHTSVYDEQIRKLLPLADGSEEVRRQLVRSDAQQACDLLLETVTGDKPLDGWVAVEVDPRFTADPAETVRQAQWLSGAVGRPNLLLAIPVVSGGLIAIEDATALGLSVMATGVYSPTRYRETAMAYWRGLARLAASGGDPGTVTSVASVPVSAMDEKAGLRLTSIGRRHELIGTLGTAMARLIRAEYLSLFTRREWKPLAALGATPQRCLWSGLTSSGLTMPDGRQPEVRYVESLVGRDTGALLTPHSAEAFLAGGRVRPTLDGDLPAARRILAAHVKAGVSPKLMVSTLEGEHRRRGVQAFGDVRALIDDKLARLATVTRR
jgi:transaldolase